MSQTKQANRSIQATQQRIMFNRGSSQHRCQCKTIPDRVVSEQASIAWLL